MTEYPLSSEHVEAIIVLNECNYLLHEIVQSFAEAQLPITERQVNQVILTGKAED